MKYLIKNFKSLLIALLLLISAGIILLLHKKEGFIQVVAEPGISVFLDKNFEGKTTSDNGGLIIEKVSPGIHSARFIKEGYFPQEENIYVRSGKISAFHVKPFVPEIITTRQKNMSRPEGNIRFGKIKIRSNPVGIYISIPRLGVSSLKKRDEWITSEIPEGGYNASFVWGKRSLSHTIVVKSGRLSQLFVDMMKREIEDRSIPLGTRTITNALTGMSGRENSKTPFNSFTDARDGQVYKTVKIGNQIWMAENLNYDTGNGSWVFNDDSSNATVYGRLYNWETARNACPAGWHLPDNKEWDQLIDFLGGEEIAGGKMKEQDTLFWKNPNVGATNSSGFFALPGGSRVLLGYFFGIGQNAYFWPFTELDRRHAWYWLLDYSYGSIDRYYGNKSFGFSVRCLKDEFVNNEQ